jgi:virginiamycin B lyase
MRVLTLAGLALFALAGAASPAVAAPAASPAVDVWLVPWKNSRPRDPWVAADGKVWFCGQTADYLARFDPARAGSDAAFEQFPLEKGAGPHNLILDVAGMVWYAGNTAAHIGRIDPRLGPGVEHIAKFPMPDPAAKDPHTLVEDGRGGIWFTLQQSNMIGHLDKSSGKVRLVAVPTPKSRPYGIWLDRAGRPWANLLGTNKLATVDPKSFALREVTLPRASARTRRIEVGPDGAVWAVDYAGGFLVRFDPAREGKAEAFSEFALPGGAGSRPYGMAFDDRGRIWIAQSGDQPNTMVAFDTKTRAFGAPFVIPESHGAIRHMVFDAKRRALWFGTDTDRLVRVRLAD